MISLRGWIREPSRGRKAFHLPRILVCLEKGLMLTTGGEHVCLQLPISYGHLRKGAPEYIHQGMNCAVNSSLKSSICKASPRGLIFSSHGRVGAYYLLGHWNVGGRCPLFTRIDAGDDEGSAASERASGLPSAMYPGCIGKHILAGEFPLGGGEGGIPGSKSRSVAWLGALGH